MLTLDKIYHASYTLKKVIRPTDLIYAPGIKSDGKIYLKTENLQVTGSFKVRGAYYKISQLTDAEKEKGVIACSAGNHAQGVACLLYTSSMVAPLMSAVSPPTAAPAAGPMSTAESSVPIESK